MGTLNISYDIQSFNFQLCCVSINFIMSKYHFWYFLIILGKLALLQKPCLLQRTSALVLWHFSQMSLSGMRAYEDRCVFVLMCDQMKSPCCLRWAEAAQNRSLGITVLLGMLLKCLSHLICACSDMLRWVTSELFPLLLNCDGCNFRLTYRSVNLYSVDRINAVMRDKSEINQIQSQKRTSVCNGRY